jgi:hypothetical protein
MLVCGMHHCVDNHVGIMLGFLCSFISFSLFSSIGGFGLLYNEIHSRIKVRFRVNGIFRVCWL